MPRHGSETFDKVAAEVRRSGYRLRHWEMVQHLVWELHSDNWPFATDHPGYGRGNTASWEQVLDHVRRDPRFIDRGLIWQQPPCQWVFEGFTGDAALAQFLGWDPKSGQSSLAVLQRVMEDNLSSGALRYWVHEQVRLARKLAGMGKDFPFIPNIFYTHMQPTEVLSFDEPGWLGDPQ